MTNTNWTRSGNNFFSSTSTDVHDKLSPGVYNVCLHPMRGPYLDRVANRLLVPTKVYDLNGDFIKRVLKAYEHQTQVSALMHGVQGTSKSVTAKIIANTLLDRGVPIILVSISFSGLSEFLQTITQEAVVFFDEFEKNFSDRHDNQNEFLGLFDGALTSNVRRVYLLTANELNVNKNLLDRPGRIRYLKEFSNLDPDAVRLIVEDKLINKDQIEEVINCILRFRIISIDTIGEFINECNIHNDIAPIWLLEDFNVETYGSRYTVLLEELIPDPKNNDSLILSGQYRVIKNVADLRPNTHDLKSGRCVSEDLRIDYNTYGEIAEVRTWNNFVIESKFDRLITHEEYEQIVNNNSEYHREQRNNKNKPESEQTHVYQLMDMREGKYYYRITLTPQPPLFVDKAISYLKR